MLVDACCDDCLTWFQYSYQFRHRLCHWTSVLLYYRIGKSIGYVRWDFFIDWFYLSWKVDISIGINKWNRSSYYLWEYKWAIIIIIVRHWTLPHFSSDDAFCKRKNCLNSRNILAYSFDIENFILLFHFIHASISFDLLFSKFSPPRKVS